jgi:sugar phosphate isomerase/epimerase
MVKEPMTYNKVCKWLGHYVFCLICLSSVVTHAQQKQVPEIGVVQDIENDSLLQIFGYRYLVENTSKFLSPRTVSDEQFQEKLNILRKSRIPLYACNIFIPGDLKVVGPSVNESEVLAYVEKVFARAQQAHLTMIIWGSSGSRRVPDGFDRAKAKEQFIAIAQKIAAVASRYNIILALENLNTTEANFITTVKEALEIVKAVNHKNLRLCTDIYHMLKENESPDIILKAKGYVVYCEVAEKEGRTPPGVHGDNFRPYLSALKKIGFSGKIVIECRWENFENQGEPAYLELEKQVREVF